MPEDCDIGFSYISSQMEDSRDDIDLHIDEIAIIAKFDDQGKLLRTQTTEPETREMVWDDNVPPDMTDGFDFML